MSINPQENQFVPPVLPIKTQNDLLVPTLNLKFSSSASKARLIDTLNKQGEYQVLDSLIDIERNRQKDIKENQKRQNRLMLANNQNSPNQSDLSGFNSVKNAQTPGGTNFEFQIQKLKYDPSEPFKIRVRKERERKEQKALFAQKVERLKEVLHLKQKLLSDPREAQKQFQEAYDSIYGYSNSKLQTDLQKIEEYFHSGPDNFDPKTALEKVEDYEKKKARIQKIQNEEKRIQEMAKEKSQINSLIKQYKIKIINETQLTNHEKVMLRCQEDYRTFQKYKEGNFFEKILLGDQKEIQRKNQIKKISQELELELQMQKQHKAVQKENQKVSNFWESVRLKKMLGQEFSESGSHQNEDLKTTMSKISSIPKTSQMQQRDQLRSKIQSQAVKVRGLNSSMDQIFNNKTGNFSALNNSNEKFIQSAQFQFDPMMSQIQNLKISENTQRQNLKLDFSQKRHSSLGLKNQNRPPIISSNQKASMPSINLDQPIEEIDDLFKTMNETQDYREKILLNDQSPEIKSNAKSHFFKYRYGSVEQPFNRSTLETVKDTPNSKVLFKVQRHSQQYNQERQATSPMASELEILKNLSLNSWREPFSTQRTVNKAQFINNSNGQSKLKQNQNQSIPIKSLTKRMAQSVDEKLDSTFQRYNESFLEATPSLHDQNYRAQIEKYLNQQYHERLIKEQSNQNKQKLKNVISACYYLENDHLPINNDNKEQLIRDGGVKLQKKINMNMLQEDMRLNNLNRTYKILREFDSTDEAANIKMLYFYKVQANEDYQGLAKEVVKEYKSGVIDPSREVGRVEKSRSAVKKLIQNLKQKGQRI
eukprot:403364477